MKTSNKKKKPKKEKHEATRAVNYQAEFNWQFHPVAKKTDHWQNKSWDPKCYWDISNNWSENKRGQNPYSASFRDIFCMRTSLIWYIKYTKFIACFMYYPGTYATKQEAY